MIFRGIVTLERMKGKAFNADNIQHPKPKGRSAIWNWSCYRSFQRHRRCVWIGVMRLGIAARELLYLGIANPCRW